MRERERIGLRSAAVGVTANLLLGAAKLAIGRLSGSVSLLADAANNLSDAGTNLVSVIGTALAGKPLDKEHPFGHGRLEYVSALVVSFLILHTGVDMAKGAVQRILAPEAVKYDPLYLFLLLGATLVKLFLAGYYHMAHRKTDNMAFRALRQDSLNDCLTTGATVAVLLITRQTGAFRVDGVVGLAVSILILVSGVRILREMVDPLLGRAPSAEVVRRMKAIILSEELILGVHDLILHDYGPGHMIASAHAEVRPDHDLVALHEAVDRAEKRIRQEMDIAITLHMDPAPEEDAETAYYRDMLTQLLTVFYPGYEYHDLQILHCGEQTQLRFEVTIPFEEKTPEDVILREITRKLKKRNAQIVPIVTVEHRMA